MITLKLLLRRSLQWLLLQTLLPYSFPPSYFPKRYVTSINPGIATEIGIVNIFLFPFLFALFLLCPLDTCYSIGISAQLKWIASIRLSIRCFWLSFPISDSECRTKSVESRIFICIKKVMPEHFSLRHHFNRCSLSEILRQYFLTIGSAYWHFPSIF